MIVSRRIRICDLAKCQVGREFYFIALGEADYSVQLFAQLGILPRQNVKQLMADESLQFLLRLRQLAFWENDGRASRVGRISFFLSGGFNELNGSR